MDRDAALVAALGAAVLAGCTERRVAVPPTPSGPVTPSPADPDVATLAAWSASEQRLAVLYAPLVRAVPSLAALRRNHTARARAVEGRLRALGSARASISRPVAPHGRPVALAAGLAAAERKAAAAYVAALSGLRDPDVAVLGAELAAGARQHVVVLGRVR